MSSDLWGYDFCKIVPPNRDVFYARAHAMANDIASIFEDADHWNATHLTERPIDPDPDGGLRRMHAGILRFLRSEARLRTPGEGETP